MQKKKEIKKEVEEKIEEIKEVLDVKKVSRDTLSLQHFMDDMETIGEQIKDRSLRKPSFHYGDLAVTNYLLWLILAELMMMNDGGGK